MLFSLELDYLTYKRKHNDRIEERLRGLEGFRSTTLASIWS